MCSTLLYPLSSENFNPFTNTSEFYEPPIKTSKYSWSTSVSEDIPTVGVSIIESLQIVAFGISRTRKYKRIFLINANIISPDNVKILL